MELYIWLATIAHTTTQTSSGRLAAAGYGAEVEY